MIFVSVSPDAGRACVGGRGEDGMQQKRSDERQIAEWVKETCLLFGSSVQTAHTVASIFVEGLQRDGREARDE